MIDEDHPPQIPDKTWHDIEESQALLAKCAEFGFPLDDLVDGDDEAEHYLELFLEFNRGIVHGLSRPREEWRGAKAFLLPVFPSYGTHASQSTAASQDGKSSERHDQQG